MLLDFKDFDNLPQTEEECMQIQNNLAAKITCKNAVPPEQIKYVAGADIAYWKDTDGKECGVCCICVINRATLEIIEEVSAYGKITFPYINGCLAFRELPLVLNAAAKLKTSPDIFVFDGNGILHPRKAGLAAHASFYLNVPAFGVAKTYFKVNGVSFIMPDKAAGSFTDIAVNGEVLGRALRTRTAVKPVFVSVGNGIDLNSATALAFELTSAGSRVPVPTRLADLATHRMRKKLQNGEKCC